MERPLEAMNNKQYLQTKKVTKDEKQQRIRKVRQTWIVDNERILQPHSAGYRLPPAANLGGATKAAETTGAGDCGTSTEHDS